MGDIQNPAPDLSGAGPVEYRPAEASADLIGAVRSRQEAQLMAVPGVTFVGVGESGLLVGVIDASVAAQLPRYLEGVPVTVTVTGTVDALGSQRNSPSLP